MNLLPLHSLKRRLAVWVLLPSLAVIAIDLLVAWRGSEQIATLVQQQLLHGAATMISEQVVLVDGEYEVSVPPAAFDLLRNRFKDRVFYAVHDRRGELVAGDDSISPYQGSLAGEGETFFLGQVRGEPVRFVAYAHLVPTSESGDFVVTQVAQTLRGHEALQEELLQSTVRRHLLLTVITAVFLVAAFRWMLKPIVEFGRALASRQPGSLIRIQESQAPSELRPFAEALNDYVERLDRTLTAYEKFVANTAHHLRNSFAVIGAQVNFGKRRAREDAEQLEVFRALEKATGKCTRIINQLLMLATLDQPSAASSGGELAVMGPVVTSVIEELAPLAQQKGIELGVDVLDEQATVAGAPRFLREVVTNLVGNAIAHMKRPGEVTVAVSCRNEAVCLSVVDNGVGIPEDQREKVFERFYRIDEADSEGTGLGLAIVREICDALGATISLSAPPDGIGLRVDVVFPRVPASLL